MMNNEDLILIEQFCTYHNIDVAFIQELQEFGLISTITVQQQHYLAHKEVPRAEKMMRMHYDMNINLEGLDAISHLLERVEALQQELKSVKNKLRAFQ